MDAKNKERWLLVGDNDSGIETPGELAGAARMLLFKTQKESAKHLNLTPGTISRYESGSLAFDSRYLAFLIYRVYRVCEAEEMHPESASSLQQKDDYRRQLLRLTNRVISNSNNYGATERFQTWEELQAKATAFEAEKRRGQDIQKGHANGNSTPEPPAHLAQLEPGPQKRTALTAQEAQSEMSIAQEQAKKSPGAAALRIEKGWKRYARLKKSAAVGSALLSLVFVIGIASFFLPGDRSPAERANANSILPQSSAITQSTYAPNTPYTSNTSFTPRPSAAHESSLALATYTPYNENMGEKGASRNIATPTPIATTYSVGAVPFNGNLSSPATKPAAGPETILATTPADKSIIVPTIVLPTNDTSTRVMDTPVSTLTPILASIYAPTMTPSATATRLAVPTRTPTVSETLRTGAVCYDGSISCSTGSGTCSKHKGVSYWIYYPTYPESCP